MTTASAGSNRNSPSARLILASASPRRQGLLRDAGYEFLIEPAGIDEESFPRDLLPSDFARRLALAKAEAVAARFSGDVILAADTIVAFGDRILGKPTDEQNARWMLGLLAGTTHIVITGVAVLKPSGKVSLVTRVMSSVHMRALSGKQIDEYIQSRDWEGKAGGYGIQDKDPFVTRIAGCRTNIVGLPMTTTAELLRGVGIVPKGDIGG